MGDFLLLSREGDMPPGHLPPGHLPSKHSHANLLKKDRVQQLSPSPSPSSQPPNVARRLTSLAARLSDAIRARAGQSRAERRLLQLRNERQQILELRMANATSYEEWEAAAHLLDELEEHEAWKASSDSDEFYNPDLVSTRLKELEDARLSSDIRRMMHLVRTALSRDVGGISSAGLYNHTHTGTKYLVERYVKASVDLIQALVDRTRSAAALPKGLTHRGMLGQLLLARRSYGRSALILSGGSVYGMAHIGVLKALFDRQLLPRIISGTSAGSIVAAVVCTRTDEEIPIILERFAHGDLAVFTDKDNPDSWLTHIGRALRYGAWHDSRHIARVMRDLMGDITFQEAFNRTRRILNITVSSKPGLQLPPLLNYLTAPDVIVWSAVVASCSIPGVFDPRPLLVRDAETGEHVPWDPAEQLWIDGSLDNDVPVERLGEMLNVNHFIVSQTNPHIVLFVSSDEKVDLPPDINHSEGHGPSVIPSISEIVYTLGWLGKSEAIYYLETLVDMGLFRGSLSMLLQMLNQRYTADVNILPRMSLAWGTNLIRNPTPEFMLEACRVGEQATWPSISRIEQACAVELALDEAVHSLRERIAFSDSQVNLRRFFTGSYELGVRSNSLTGGPLVPASPSPVAASASPCAVDSNDGDIDPTSVKNMMPAMALGAAPTLSRSRSPIAYRHSQNHHHNRHKRRGSGGSIQLSARRRRNRYALETILSEDGGGQDSDSYPEYGHRGSSIDSSMSLAARRGMADMNLSAFLDNRPELTRSISYGAPNTSNPSGLATTSLTPRTPRTPHAGGEPHHRYIPPYRGAVKQNSLQQLPMSTPSKVQTPSPTTSFARKGYNWVLGERAVGNTSTGGLAPFTTLTNDDENATDEEESPLLQMKARQRLERRNSSTSAVSAVSAAAVAAVAAAHQAVMQAVGGGSSSGGPVSTITEPQPPRAQRTPPVHTSAIPTMSRVSSTEWYPGVVRRPPPDDTSEETDSGDFDPYEQDGIMPLGASQAARTPPRPVRLVRRCKSVPAMAMSVEEQLRRRVLPQTPPSRKRTLSEESVEHDHTEEEEVEDEIAAAEKEIDADNDDDSDVFMRDGRVRRVTAGKTTATVGTPNGGGGGD